MAVSLSFTQNTRLACAKSMSGWLLLILVINVNY